MITLLLIVGVGMMFSKSAEPKKVDESVVMGGGRYHQGNKDAKINVVEFSDFQCPACRSTEPLVKELMDKYSDKIQFTYRHYPLVQIHKNAQIAAQAGEAAGTMNKFWEMHDQLFANQDAWAEKTDKEAQDLFIEYAAKIQIDKTEFQKKMNSQEIKDNVAADVSVANKLNVGGTPTFFVNGVETAAPQLLQAVESLTKQQ